MIEISLRNATLLDFEQIAKISVAAYQEYAKVLTAENWQKMEQSLSNVEQTATVASFIVAEVEDKIVGAVAYYPLSKSNSQFFDSNCASLRLLAVDPQYRGQGIGKKLTLEGIKRAKKDRAKAIGLYTSEAMTTAQRLYGSLGFEQVKELPQMLDLRYWLYILPLNR